MEFKRYILTDESFIDLEEYIVSYWLKRKKDYITLIDGCIWEDYYDKEYSTNRGKFIMTSDDPRELLVKGDLIIYSKDFTDKLFPIIIDDNNGKSVCGWCEDNEDLYTFISIDYKQIIKAYKLFDDDLVKIYEVNQNETNRNKI